MLSGVEWAMDGVDTPQTVMTTRAPAVLKRYVMVIVKGIEISIGN